MTSLVQWLDSVRATAIGLSITAFVLLNGIAIAAFLVRRDREMVNRWTGRVLAANVLLVGTGVGVPALAWVARTAVVALAPSSAVMPVDPDREAQSEVRVLRLRR